MNTTQIIQLLVGLIVFSVSMYFVRKQSGISMKLWISSILEQIKKNKKLSKVPSGWARPVYINRHPQPPAKDIG